MGKKKQSKNIYLSRGALKSALIRTMRLKPKAQFHAKQLTKKLKINNSTPQVVEILRQLCKQGTVKELDGQKFIIDEGKIKYQKASTASGYVDMIRSGAAFIMVDGMEMDVYVPRSSQNGALHGDLVEVEYKGKRGSRPDGKVIKVLNRAIESFQGTLRRKGKDVLVSVEHKGQKFDVKISNQTKWKSLAPGDPVIVKVNAWSNDRHTDHAGSITSVMTDMSPDDIQMSSILMTEGFELQHNADTLREAEAIPNTLVVSEEQEKIRKDFRGVKTFTIDPTDAKDFDDALSIEALENGNFILGVHIADVTHYVNTETALDKEAFDRSTSVYLVDRVLPMLPEKLSNNLCSLRPNEDRYSFSAWFELDPEFKILKRNFGKSIIHSDHRFSYGDAQKVLDGEENPYSGELQLMNKIAKRYRKARMANGALNFETDEIRFILDDDGNPVSVYIKDRQDAHLLVEEFMLLANREVATFIFKKSSPAVPFVYRIHDLPDEDKLEDVKLFAREMGLELNFDHPKQIAKSFNKLRKAAKADPRFKILEPMGIRAMSKAIYSPENIGHYGLAFDNYTHFTSPIRRYSDVLVHRILQENIKAEKRWNIPALESQCKHISRQERKAQKAERESIKFFQMKYMKQYEGKVLEGMINGFIEIGFFVAMTDSKAEGMVMFDSLKESYEVEESRLRAKGNKTGTVLKVGDIISVFVEQVDLVSRKITLRLIKDKPVAVE